MSRTLRLSAVIFAIAALPACGWLSGSGDDVFLDPELLGGVRPTCRPTVDEGTVLWAVGDTTPGGWAVTKVDDEHPEFARITFAKADVTTTLEIGYSDGTASDWSTDKHKLMPAPDETPPAELLDEAMAQLRERDAKPDAKPFARRIEGVENAYADLPPCE